MKKKQNTDIRIEGIEPLLVSITHAINYVGIGVNSIKRLAARDPNFPPIIRLSHTKVLVDVQAIRAYLNSKAGNAPEPLRKRTPDEVAKFNEKWAAGGYTTISKKKTAEREPMAA